MARHPAAMPRGTLAPASVVMLYLSFSVVATVASGAISSSRQQATVLPMDAATRQQEWNDVCRFYSQSAKHMEEEMRGPGTGDCAGPKWHTWWQRAGGLCVSCYNKTNVCKNPPVVTFHTYLEALHPREWRANLMFIKAFLLTQDLRRTRLVIWTPNADDLLYDPRTAEFFRAFDRVVEVHSLWWYELVFKTPVETHTFFGNDTLLERATGKPAFMDMLRLLALYKYGGVWLDADVIMLKDVYPLTAHVGYQYSARLPGGNHFLRMLQRGLLGKKVLELINDLPADEDAMLLRLDELCKPLGYTPPQGEPRSFSDYLHGCVLRLAFQPGQIPLAANETGPLHVLHELPVSWFDPTHKRCINIRDDLTVPQYKAAVQRYVAVQSQYPAIPHSVYPIGSRSLLGRTMDAIETFFDGCADWGCMELPPVDFLGMLQQQEAQ
jgi:hypothetical protein